MIHCLGQLGVGGDPEEQGDEFEPRRVIVDGLENGEFIDGMSAGEHHSLAKTNKGLNIYVFVLLVGGMYGCGRNDDGQLGIATKALKTFTKIDFSHHVTIKPNNLTHKSHFIFHLIISGSTNRCSMRRLLFIRSNKRKRR